MIVNGYTKILGVLGYPVRHTLSPILHNYLIDKYKLNLIYIPYEVRKNNLDTFISGIRQIDNLLGFNITVPYKADIIKHLDRISDEARRINAVNTVKLCKNIMAGCNTDLFGFKKSIEINYPAFKTFKNKEVLLLGAGGAARAAAFVLLKNGVKQLVILNRTYQKAVNLMNILQKIFKVKNIKAEKLDFEYLNMVNYIPDLIINTTSMGLKKNDGILLDLKYLKNRDTVVYDLIYNPAMTGLLKSAVHYKMPVLNGLDMLILQALESFSIWTGIPLEDELMKHAVPLRNKLKKLL